MAYATIADLPVQVGLYTCMVPMAVYALVGGSRTLSVSTTSTIAVLTASTLVAGSVAPVRQTSGGALATLTLLVGAILIVARILRLGSLVDNISGATLTGVKVGVGLTVAAGQLPKLLGVAGDPDATSFFAEARASSRNLDELSGATSSSRRDARRAGRRAAADVAGAGAARGGRRRHPARRAGSLDEHGLALIAPVPSGLPTPVAADPRRPRGAPAGRLRHRDHGLPGDAAAVAGSVRRRSEPPIDNDQELVASGRVLALGAFFRAMPSAGGFSQTAISQRSGARTQLCELVTVALAIGLRALPRLRAQRPAGGNPRLHGRDRGAGPHHARRPSGASGGSTGSSSGSPS